MTNSNLNPKNGNITIITGLDNIPMPPPRKPKCCTMCCLSFVATLFFLIGLFQTIVALVFVEASRRNPILVMGPMFMAIGGLLYMGVFEMCRTRRRLKKIAETGEDPNQYEEEGNLHMNGNVVVIRADQLPPLLTLNPDDLKKLSFEEKRLLLAQPSLPPVDVCAPAPTYYSGNSRIPQVANYTPPEDGEPITVEAMAAENGIVEKAQSEDLKAPEIQSHASPNVTIEPDEIVNAQQAQQEISEALTKIMVAETPAVQ